ncbi:DUF1840 domain-containing protein [Roseateles oligotrophus]|uniref:DUF1840 domain-containing protein n=1 Tax=Roseateles oligotrophus TaxID=1769250 RepID=A0ABT2YI19_9BURK|nr:DUF1840 domain-containing protein [Roseateles oligotrophus]MCV2369694.1 DUF1840 domain-containing protein [Roseateles oligotrophus]
MIYKFKSKAGADVIMMGPQGDQILALLGREPAAQGLLAVTTLTQAMASLERAAAEDDAAFAAQQAEALAAGLSAPRREGISLRQRVWPLRELMRHSLEAGQDVFWGV